MAFGLLFAVLAFAVGSGDQRYTVARHEALVHPMLQLASKEVLRF